MFDLDTSIHIVGHVLIVVCVEDLPAWWHLLYATSLIVPVFMRFQLSWLDTRICHIFPAIMEILIYCISSAIMEIMVLFVYLHHGNSDLCILYVAMTTYVISWLCLFMAIVLLCIRDCYMYLQLYAKLYYCTMLIGWLVFHLGTFITSFLGWNYNVFRPSHNPSDLIH